MFIHKIRSVQYIKRCSADCIKTKLEVKSGKGVKGKEERKMGEE